jgi:hypothetical protein
MFNRYLAIIGCTFALAAVPFAALAAAPAPMPAMDMSTIDCSTATTHMMSMMTPPADAMASMKSDDTDKAYTAMMKMMVMHAAEMSQIEMKCGKNAKVMATAKKMEGDLDSNYLIMEALQTGF